MYDMGRSALVLSETQEMNGSRYDFHFKSAVIPYGASVVAFFYSLCLWYRYSISRSILLVRDYFKEQFLIWKQLTFSVAEELPDCFATGVSNSWLIWKHIYLCCSCRRDGKLFGNDNGLKMSIMQTMVSVKEMRKSLVMPARSWKVERSSADEGKICPVERPMEVSILDFVYELQGCTNLFQH